MNKDIFEGRWKQIRGDVKRLWGDITDDELDTIDGNRDKLAGVLQERFGWTRERTEQELDKFASELETRYGDRY
jgi:uncharacterized protein YjbJ (UPF0337 family)